jgi:recombination protein RecR
LRIKELLARLGDTQEIIIATNPDIEGEATAIYLSRLLKPLGVRVSRIAQGISIGSDIEFVDEATLSRAIDNRVDF